MAETSLDQLRCDSVPIKHFVPLSFDAVPVAGRSVFQLISALSKSCFFAGGLCWYINFADCHCSVTDQTQGTRRHAEFH